MIYLRTREKDTSWSAKVEFTVGEVDGPDQGLLCGPWSVNTEQSY